MVIRRRKSRGAKKAGRVDRPMPERKLLGARNTKVEKTKSSTGTFRRLTRFGEKTVALTQVPDEVFIREKEEYERGMALDVLEEFFPSMYADEMRKYEYAGNELPSSHHANDVEMYELALRRAGKSIRKGKLKILPRSIQRGPDGKMIIWMPYKESGELHEFLKSASPLSVKRAYLKFMDNLGHLHSTAGIAHNDIKKKGGSNLFIWAPVTPHFSDFGDSRNLFDAKEERMNPSAPQFMLRDLEDGVSVFKKHLKDEEIAKGISRYQRTLQRNLDAKKSSSLGDLWERDLAGYPHLRTLKRSELLPSFKRGRRRTVLSDHSVTPRSREEYFYTHTGPVIRNLDELRGALTHMPDEVYNYHAKRGDWSRWAKDVFGLDDLAERMQGADKRKVQEILSK
jgi:hypothetical protein